MAVTSPSTGATFKFFGQQLTQAEAQTACNAQGMHLAGYSSRAEQAEVRTVQSGGHTLAWMWCQASWQLLICE